MDLFTGASARRFGWFAAMVSPSFVPLTVLAQAVPAPQPPVPNPSVPTRDQIDPAAPSPRDDVARATIDRGPPSAGACSLTDSDKRIMLTEVRYEASGGGALSSKLAALLGGIGSGERGDQPVAVVCAVRDRANAALRRAGYLASIQIPPQDLTDGVLRLIVVTARITEIRVQGDLGRFRSVLEPRLAAIRALENPTEQQIEKLLLLIDDIPGVSVKLALKPAGTAPGEVIGDLTVETRRATALLNVQNAGSKQLGREVASLRGEIYGLTGRADRTYFTYSNTIQFKEANILQVGHDMGIGSHGVRVGVRASYALSNPDLDNLDLRSRSLIAGVDLSLPIVRSLKTNLSFSTGFELLNQQSQIISGGSRIPFTRDRIRIAYGRFDGQLLGLRQDGGERWRLGASLELRQGLALLNATRAGAFENGFQPSRIDGSATATVVRGTIDGSVFLTRGFLVNGSVFGQWANKALLNLEEFSLGSLTYGRGYDPGANSADRVVAFRIEPRLRVPLGGGTPGPGVLKDMQLEFMGFYEGARIYNLDLGTKENDRLLRSEGGGIRLLKPGRFALDVTYARPLDRALTDDKERPHSRVLVSFTLQLLPWRSGR